MAAPRISISLARRASALDHDGQAGFRLTLSASAPNRLGRALSVVSAGLPRWSSLF